MKPSVSLKDSIKADCERRERERERDRERMSRERDRDRDRDRDNDRRERDRRDFNRLPRHLTASADDPKLLASRVFIGNLPTENMIGNSELEDVFKKYGKILGVNMLKGYGFVQFEREEDARIAIEEENHSLYKGYRIDVKMAVEGRGGQNTKRPVGRRPSPPPRQRDRSPLRDTLGRDEPYARPPARDPYLDRDRDPFAREAYHPPPPRDPYTPGPPFDAMLIVADPKVRGFGEAIERRLRLIKGMAIDFNVLRDAVNLPKALEEASVKKMLYAIVVNDQNEIHRSLTLNVLHGTPQEHRNMPLDDALSFVSRNYADYIKERELKAAAPTPLPVKPGATPDFTPPDKQTSYLLNLLADNRYLTVDELDNVIDYLLSRREKLAGQTGVPARKHHEKPVPAVVMKDEQAIAAQQQELQQKILNILNGSNNGGSPASQTPPKQSYGAMPPNSGPSLGVVSPPINPASINLDNPSVQKALDNLISGGSSLLKNIAAVKNPGVGPNLAGLVGQGGPGPGQYAQRRDPYQDDQYRNDMLPQGPGGGPPSHHHQHDGYNNSQGGGNYQQARETYGGEYGGYRDQNMGRGGHHPGQYGRY